MADMENITPSKRALAVLDKPVPTKSIPAKRISKKVCVAIDALVSGECKTITDAAAKAGLARESLSRALNSPHVAEHLRQKIKRSLAVGAARAGVTKLALLDSPNEMVRDRASSYVLGLIGIVPEPSPVDRPGIQQAGLQIVIYGNPDRPPVTVGPAPVQIEQEPSKA
jgi:hypothetical protein